MAEREAACVICRDAAPHNVIAESEHCWVTAAPTAPMPGYVCVVSKTHVTEPFFDSLRKPWEASPLLVREACDSQLGQVALGDPTVVGRLDQLGDAVEQRCAG